MKKRNAEQLRLFGLPSVLVDERGNPVKGKRSYHNTTKLPPRKVAEFEAQAERQEDIVIFWFQEMDIPAPPSLVHEELISRNLIGGNTPLTSIRRAISNLTKEGLLRKTDEQMPGAFGRPEYCWKLKARKK